MEFDDPVICCGPADTLPYWPRKFTLV